VEVDYKEYQEVRVEATQNTDGRNKGAILAVVTILVLAVVIILILVFCIKCRRPKKNPEVGLTFTNMSYGNPAAPAQDRELNTIQVVKRGTTVGYDNPGFDSPVDFFKRSSGPRLSTMNWSDSPVINSADPVICEGSSTPANSRAAARGKDADSAFQEPSTAASSFDDNRHFSVDDEDLEQHLSVSFYKDKQRLI